MPTSILPRADQVIEEVCLLQRMNLFFGTKLPIWDVPATGRDREYPGHAPKAPR
jgi:hypothetical protein